MTLLSVVIPTYNRGHQMAHGLENYLSALRRGAEETGTSFECILVDDHSSDGSFAPLQQRFGQTGGLRLLQMPANAGPGPTRDAGVAVAQGTWIWFLDDDDALDPIHLPALFAALQQAPAGVDVVSHSLKHSYPAAPEKAGLDLAQRVMAFREFQEVFRHVVRKDLLTRNGIRFSPGLHEDIRYVVELMLRARGVSTLAQAITLKQRTEDAITARMNTRRIDGYVQAYNETRALLEGSVLDTPRLRQLFLVQALGVLLLLITREPGDDPGQSFLAHLQLCSQGTDAWSREVAQLPTFGPLATNFEYAGALWRAQPTPDAAMLASLRAVFSTRLSCKDLDASLFLGPDEIRACCKRFFVNGIRKGDVVLLKADAQVDLPRIQTAKQALIDRINAGSAPECSGCPYIERRPVHRGGIDYLSLENFAYCNMQCTYCSPKYYGGTEAQYNAAAVVAQVAQLPGGFDAQCHVVWGGGEPTLSPRFADINRSLAAMPQSGKIRVLSNSLKYSTNLESQLRDPRFHLVTSIDAGTEATFKSLRGKGGLNEVLANLVRYQQVLDDPRRLTIKYIVGAGNYSSQELQAYVAKLAGSPLLDSLFQVSCDFTLDAPEDGLVCALYELSLRLLSQGARFVFFDDLVRDRVRMDAARARRVRQHLAEHQVDEQHLWTPEAGEPVVLWGAGKQAEWLTRHTVTGMAGRILGTAQDERDYRTLSVNPSGVEGSGDKRPAIFPAGVQSLYDIIRNIERAGLGAQMVRGVML
jgi:hypothetical protein